MLNLHLIPLECLLEDLQMGQMYMRNYYGKHHKNMYRLWRKKMIWMINSKSFPTGLFTWSFHCFPLNLMRNSLLKENIFILCVYDHNVYGIFFFCIWYFKWCFSASNLADLKASTVEFSIFKVILLVTQPCRLFVIPWTSPPGSSVHGILQARILEQGAIPFSRGSSRTRDQTQVTWIAGGLFTIWAALYELKP